MVIIVVGLPGSGKTYFADHLAETINAARINSDRVRDDLQKMGQYDIDTKMQVYDEMVRQMKQALKKGYDVIVDATFYKAAIREKFKEAAETANQKLLFIEVKANDETIKERLDRPRSESEADYAVYQKIKHSFEPLTEEHLTLYSDKLAIEEMLNKAQAYLS